ncbi:hypothetical protein QBC41DRAFT_321797 [Cercophora samala]|uniref:Uncharacterized protein n=1 Tax=Cercophora samala TaxID=330535 RepID=A0AA39ZDK4_9PEZI|nr:hypothetical protein QBC41DRAFT_321797 [Cercophora samala]
MMTDLYLFLLLLQLSSIFLWMVEDREGGLYFLGYIYIYLCVIYIGGLIFRAGEQLAEWLYFTFFLDCLFEGCLFFASGVG